MMRRLFLIPFLLAASFAARADNPFGVMLWPAPGQDFAMMAARAGALGVAWFRPPTLYVDRWRADAPCPACRDLARSGLSLVLTVRDGGRDAPPGRPAAPPGDLAAYGRIVGAMLDRWRPAMLAVEEEENRLYRYAGTPQDYRLELGAACAEAHRRGISCTNGGLSFDAVTALTWLTLLRDGKPDLACDYARRAFYDRFAGICAYRRAADVPPPLRERLLEGADALLPVYREAPIDAVNFQWDGGDAMALSQTIDALSHLTGKTVMSNRLSLRRADADPSHVRPLLRAAIAGGMKVAIWYSFDGQDSVALFDREGRLRPAGEEFAHQMSGRK